LEKEGWESEARDGLVRALSSDYASAEIPPADVAMLDYAMKLTLSPSKIKENDINTLRANGFDDRAIHDICAITAYFAFVNRVADGLGVELEK
jgi:uncharacterized peroxidase-related enzyme